MDMIRQMDMSYSYKPVLMKAIMLYADEKGRIKLDDIGPVQILLRGPPYSWPVGGKEKQHLCQGRLY